MTETANIPKGLYEALERIRSVLRNDGGDIEFLEWTRERCVRIRLTGRCKGCPKAGQTFKNIVERALLKLVPEVRGVEHVEDHCENTEKDTSA